MRNPESEKSAYMRLIFISVFASLVVTVTIGAGIITNPSSFQGLNTPIPTPSLEPTATPLSSFEWERNPSIGYFIRSLRNLGENPLVVLIAGTVIGGILTLTGKSILQGIKFLINQIWIFFKTQSKDFAFEREYLDWLVSQNRHLGLLPAQMLARRWGERQQFVDLENVYIRLSLSSQSGDELWVSTPSEGEYRWKKQPGRVIRLLWSAVVFIADMTGTNITISQNLFVQRYLYGQIAERIYQPGSLGLSIDRHPCLILRGDPGCGKTTILRFLALTCARSLRNDRSDHDWSLLAYIKFGWTAKPFPILLRLNRHSHIAERGATYTLIDAFQDEMPVDLRNHCPKDFFERQLKNRPCLILLDAFDELGSRSVRSMMAEYIQGFLNTYTKSMHRMVVSTRIVGYEGQLDRIGFFSRTVQPLESGEIRALIKQRYKAFAIAESIGRSSNETHTIGQRLQERASKLIERIEKASRLQELAKNPMLLSLITLVHFLKFELPEERAMLYRDCVEILTERWARFKREESGSEGTEANILSLTQKFVVLRDLALAMQEHRDPASSLAVITKRKAKEIIAHRLPDVIGMVLPQDDLARRAYCIHLAESWLDNIEVESGILVEPGLDYEGEPLIGFSHLTFQEYLAAVAIKETADAQEVLISNLLNPAWREVVLLYVLLVEDASPVVKNLLEVAKQPTGLLLAGRCLVEKVRKLLPAIHDKIIEGLKEICLSTETSLVCESVEILGRIRNPELTPFLLKFVHDSFIPRQREAIKALANIQNDDPEIEIVRQQLVQTLDLEYPLEVKIAARETLAKIGDPRFTRAEPVMLPVVLKTDTITNVRPEDYSPEIASLPALLGRWMARSLDSRLYERSKNFIHSLLKVDFDSFEISRYLITNLEYSRFVEETGHSSPYDWIEGIFPQEEATHPVVGVNFEDARKYCQWLSQKTGKQYRLPTEWEWERSAAGAGGTPYPWGEDFDNTRCNTREAEIEDTTTPVGIYFNTKSQYGLQDTCGNARELTIGYEIFEPFSDFLRLVSNQRVRKVISLLAVILVLAAMIITPGFSLSLIGILFILSTGYLLFFLSSFWLTVLSNQNFAGSLYVSIKGGSYRTFGVLSTCYYRTFASRNYIGRDIGFRVVRPGYKAHFTRLTFILTKIWNLIKPPRLSFIFYSILIIVIFNIIRLPSVEAFYYFERGMIITQFQIAHPDNSLADFKKATQLQPQNAEYWNAYCWHGGLTGHATDVVDACERAVVLAPDNGNIRDSRGLVRALIGNQQGAIDDFRYAIERWKAEGSYQGIKMSREEWIKDLEAGQNPFDIATLEKLLRP